MAQESNFSADGGVGKRKAGCLAVGIWRVRFHGAGSPSFPTAGRSAPRARVSAQSIPVSTALCGCAGLGYPHSAPLSRCCQRGDTHRGGAASTLQPCQLHFFVSFL